MLISSGSPIQCNCDNQLTKLTDDNLLMSKDQLPVTGKVLSYIKDHNLWYVHFQWSPNEAKYNLPKALYFGGSSWKISWLHYILGPMKCTGKPQPYPSELEALEKKTKEQKFVDVIDQAKVNQKNLNVLNNKIQSETENITVTFENEIDNVEEDLQNKAEDFKDQLKILTNEISILRANFSKTINRVEKQCMTYFTGLTARVDAQSVISKGRPSIIFAKFTV